MIFEDVNFNEAVIKTMTAQQFEKAHLNAFWRDRDEATRKKMLGKVYEKITKPAKTKVSK